LDLWDVISTARQTPEDANLPMVFQLLDFTLVDLDTRSQLRITGEAGSSFNLESICRRRSHKRNRDIYIPNLTTAANPKIKYNLTKTFWLDCILVFIN
jgi:hypothetical protein